MFLKKKNTKEEFEQLEHSLESGNQLLVEFSGKKEWVESNYSHIGKSRQQVEEDCERILEHINSASEAAKHQSELSAKITYDLEAMRNELERSAKDYEVTATLIEECAAESQNQVEENKHFTTPSKYLSELPGELRAEHIAYKENVTQLTELSRQMGVLALNAAIEAGRLGEQGRQFVAAAEEIRSYSRQYEDSTQALIDKIAASDAKITEMEEVIHHLIALLKESNIGCAHRMKELFRLKKHVEDTPFPSADETVKTVREGMLEIKNGSEEIIKSEERSRMQMDDISEELEEQKRSEQELLGELQKLFYATGLYVERLQKEE